MEGIHKQSVICYINSTIINLNIFTIHLFVHSRFFVMLVMFSLFATYPQERSCLDIGSIEAAAGLKTVNNTFI